MNTFKQSFWTIYLVLTCILTATGQQRASKQTTRADFILHNNQAWLLSQTGDLTSVDIGTDMTDQPSEAASGIIAIAKDRRGTLIVANRNNEIKQFDKAHQEWKRIGTYSGTLSSLFVDSQHRPFAITDNGVLAIQTDKLFFPDTTFFLNNQIRNKQRWFETPTCFIDSQDRIWIGFGYGEWGGDVFVFDTRSRSAQFMSIKLNQYRINLNPVQSFAEGEQSVFMTTGMAHFTSHGSIVAFDNLSARVVLSSESSWEPTTITNPLGVTKEVKHLKGGEYVGPTAYNTQDKHLYFYSQNGIFKGNPANDLSDMSKWKLVVKPQLQWTNGQKNAVGPAMNVLKMQFSPDGTLFFLTEHNGLGIYKDEVLRFVK